MTGPLRKAAEMALQTLENPWKAKPEGVADAIQALRQALAQPEQEQPKHWSDCAVYNEPAYPNGECDCGGFDPNNKWHGLTEEEAEKLAFDVIVDGVSKTLTHPQQDPVKCMYPYCETASGCDGPCSKPLTTPVDAVNMSQERVDETAKREHEPVAWVCRGVYSFTGHCPECEPLYTAPPTMPDDLIATYEKGFRDGQAKREHKPVAWMHELSDGHRHCVTKDESGYVDNFTDTYKTIPLYTAPPHYVSDVKKREWVGLTDEEIKEYKWMGQDVIAVIKEVQATLKEKNCGTS